MITAFGTFRDDGSLMLEPLNQIWLKCIYLYQCIFVADVRLVA